MTCRTADPNRPFSPGSVAGQHRSVQHDGAAVFSFKDNHMTTLISSLLLGYRTRSRLQSIHHLDDRMLADIGLTRDDFRRGPTKKIA